MRDLKDVPEKGLGTARIDSDTRVMPDPTSGYRVTRVVELQGLLDRTYNLDGLRLMIEREVVENLANQFIDDNKDKLLRGVSATAVVEAIVEKLAVATLKRFFG